MISSLRVEIFSSYLEDKGTSDNVFNLEPVLLKQREVLAFDVINDSLKDNKGGRYNIERFMCEKAQRGPLMKDWIETQNEVMCSYKLIKSSVPIIVIQNKAENAIMEGLRLLKFCSRHTRTAVMWLDDWFDITFGEYERVGALLLNQPDHSTCEIWMESHE